MKTNYHIIDSPIPLSQNFNGLKQEGIAFINEVSGNEWTNLNPSDPGITILDQICFALTELGYCTDFPIKDILSNKANKLKTKNQFYKPEKLLTTSPITINDYRKALIDAVDGVDNAVIEIQKNTIPSNACVYKVHLLLNSKLLSSLDKKQVCQTAFLYLNSIRNIGESFQLAKPLTVHTFLISGQLNLNSVNAFGDLINSLEQEIKNYIFPIVNQYSYNELKEKGIDINSIYNGPRLQNGWIIEKELGSLKSILQISEIENLLTKKEAIESADSLSFMLEKDNKTQDVNGISLGENELIQIDLRTSIIKGDLKICFENKQFGLKKTDKGLEAVDKVFFRKLLDKYKNKELNDTFGLISKVKSKPTIPKGKHRKIRKYYSIQNTFPETYGVGENAIKSNASEYSIAQSRQLKGYLTLFDQILANQFSQLDNLGKLLSFKNSISGDPKDKKQFYKIKDEYQKKHIEYPVPYLKFTPTYFYQSLYKVPNIRSLLKGVESFDSNLVTTSKKEQKVESWKAYQNSPYNPYIHGLMTSIEQPCEAYNRRNEILNHLLSRHGQSPVLIDEIIRGADYTGDKNQDQVIFKSLYLQNFALLNYFESKAYDYLGANKIRQVLLIPIDGINKNPKRDKSYYVALQAELLKTNNGKFHLTIPFYKENEAILNLRNELSTDFIFNSHEIDALEKLRTEDFRAYSGITLKLNLLLGLRSTYRSFILDSIEHMLPQQLIDQAYWFMQKKGAIVLETSLIANNLCNDKAKLIAKNQTLFNQDIIIICPDFVERFTTSAFQNQLDLVIENSLPIYIAHKLYSVKSIFLKEFIPIYIKWHNLLINRDESKINELKLIQLIIQKAKKSARDFDRLKDILEKVFNLFKIKNLRSNIVQLEVLLKNLIKNGFELIDKLIQEQLIVIERTLLKARIHSATSQLLTSLKTLTVKE